MKHVSGLLKKNDGWESSKKKRNTKPALKKFEKQ